jgi:uncharacterized coiled-coil DUF342 family protein
LIPSLDDGIVSASSKMETWQKYHQDRTTGVENSHSSFRRHNKVPRISNRSSLARRAHRYNDEMDGIGELRAEMIARFEQIDRRLDESFAAITQQFVEQRAYTDFAYERLDRADQSLSAGIARLERKLDRILALAVESRTRRP